MDMSKKVAKYNIVSLLKSIKTFYIIVFVIALASVLFKRFFYADKGEVQGLEITTMIYLFIIGIASFREGFYLCQGNNVSRKDFFKGSVMTALILSVGMSAISIVINVVLNVISYVPMIYNMAFISFNNIVLDMICNFIFLMILFMMIFQLGFLIGQIYFLLMKRGQIIFSIIMVSLFIAFCNAQENVPFAKSFLESIFGNVFSSIFSLFVIFAVVTGMGYKFIKRAQVLK